MNYYAIINGINSLCALTVVIIIILRRPRKPVHLTYAFFYFLMFLWASTYYIWGIQKDFKSSMFWIQLLAYPVCFIHVSYLHFVLQFSENLHRYKKYLNLGYALSIFFAIINANNGFFNMSYVRDRAPFHYWPHATPFLSMFIAFQISYILFSFFILLKSIQTSNEPLKIRLKVFLALAIVGWSGGFTSWFHFYDATPIHPIGNPAVTVYILGSAYLTFKHDILGLNLVVKKTFVYTALTLFITLIYTLFILIFERAFQTVVGYKSFAMSILFAMTIVLLFNPLRLFLIKLIDRTFFGMDIEKLSSENILMRDELAKQNRMKSIATLAAGMAHEIKNPLTSIRTFAEYLPQKYDDPTFRDKFSRIVTDEVDRINNIVRQLLEFSKPAEPELKPITIGPLLDETLNLMSNNMLSNNIGLVRDLDACPDIFADKNQLKQVFLNLFLNCIQSMKNGGRLTVSSRLQSSGYIRISVSDTGCGMAKEQLSHLFDPFYTTREEGTGLGLAIVHSIIKKHGGKVEVQSEVGRGTTISVFLKSRD